MIEYKKVFSKWSIPAIIVNKEYKLIDINEGISQLFRNHEIKLNLTKCHKLFYESNIPCEAGFNICPVAKTFERGEKFRVIHKHKTDMGEIVHEIITTPIFDEHGEIEYVLAEYHSGVQEFRGLITMCSACKKIRMEDGKWKPVVEYIQCHTTGVEISHGYCDCCKNKMGL
ncbi:MAG: hypothetical protein ACYSTS_08805 [Planctomycetota bacterium]|jgi:hypothetical protein